MRDIQAAPLLLTSDAPEGLSRLWRIAPLALLIVLLLLVVVLIGSPLRVLNLHIPLSYNEGWNAFHTARLMDGGPLYPPITPAIFNNYLPLSFYVVGAIGKVTGDYIVAGRILSLLSLFVVALDIGFICRSLECDRFIAMVTALTFLVFVALSFPDYIARDDPEWFGHALQVTGLAVLLRRPEFSVRTLFATALLFILGGLAKQTLVVLPLAVTLWLLFENRRLALRWSVIAGILAALTILSLVIFGGNGFIEQVISAGRNYGSYIFRILAFYDTCLLAYPALATIGIFAFWRKPNTRLIALWLILGAVLGLAMMTAVGVFYNVLFDAVIAAAIGTALAARFVLDWHSRYGDGSHTAMTKTILVSALPLLLTPPVGLADIGFLDKQIAVADGWQDSINRLASAPGPVACETLALCYWAHRQSTFEFFNFGQYVIKHPAFANATKAQIADEDLAMIQMDQPGGSFRLSPELNAVIAAHYAPLSTDPTTLLVPRALATSPSAR
jgi:hypothetical protein